ncbi:MAG: hypothetical protein PHH59_11865 [Methylovulum sp.]|uniref:hypothetical protein n=1 Tax=Methylovulum sp. TaxID=1916980 RepID=UPI002612D1B9|nr:hypothetical protein [Methylovulum sp.]MDD2724703.1 hypothetical protein [Methylovulum sp.]MDD5124672.1 hypothetical protein [Methylovulum sp.]
MLLADVLLELLAWQQKQIDQLGQEILKLKGETTKPDRVRLTRIRLRAELEMAAVLQKKVVLQSE